MAKIKPSLRATETYTESNFLRLHTQPGRSGEERLVTLEHLSYRAAGDANTASGWRCSTIVDGEPMSKEDAIFIARAYAEHNGIPVIYESHGD